MKNLDHLNVPIGWMSIPDDSKPTFTGELAAEITQEHTLYARQLEPILKCESCDDVLFSDNSTNEYFNVHLTWTQKKEVPPWPRSEQIVFENIESELRNHSDQH